MELHQHYADRPVEVAIRLFGWGPGESEVEISIPETSELAGALENASPEEAAAVFDRLRRHLVAELADAFHFLGADREAVATRR